MAKIDFEARMNQTAELLIAVDHHVHAEDAAIHGADQMFEHAVELLFYPFKGFTTGKCHDALLQRFLRSKYIAAVGAFRSGIEKGKAKETDMTFAVAREFHGEIELLVQSLFNAELSLPFHGAFDPFPIYRADHAVVQPQQSAAGRGKRLFQNKGCPAVLDKVDQIRYALHELRKDRLIRKIQQAETFGSRFAADQLTEFRFPDRHRQTRRIFRRKKMTEKIGRIGRNPPRLSLGRFIFGQSRHNLGKRFLQIGKRGSKSKIRVGRAQHIIIGISIRQRQAGQVAPHLGDICRRRVMCLIEKHSRFTSRIKQMDLAHAYKNKSGTNHTKCDPCLIIDLQTIIPDFRRWLRSS